MPDSAATFVQERQKLIGRLEAIVREDPRLTALWLQGSLADGTEDPLSDVDAYLAVEDEAFDAVYAERQALVARLGTVLAYADGLIPGLKVVNCLLDGPVKLDLFFERRSAAPEQERPAVRLLVDKVGVGAKLKQGWAPPVQAATARLDAIFRGTLQGGAWPVRLLLRGQLATFAMCETIVINDNIATFMAAQLDAQLLFKNRFSQSRHLRPEQQAELQTLTDAVLRALEARDAAALLATHLRIFDAIVREGRAAYAALGMPYPGSAETAAAIRAFYERAWPEQLVAPE
jgi:hypothetical protein